MKKIVLASQSPRRKQLLEIAEVNFEIIIADVDETNPPGMPGHLVPEHLAVKKATAIKHLAQDAIIIAADTIVLLDEKILGKPTDEHNAFEMIKSLSGRPHTVVSGVCIMSSERLESFSVTTQVYFRQLTDAQIKHYIEHYKPYDKAGAYAIQEWIGVMGIEKIDGDYYNVMGLPIGNVMDVLKNKFDY